MCCSNLQFFGFQNFDFSPSQILTKWRNMYNRYKSFVDNVNISGEKAKPKPKHNETFHEMLHEKPVINPQYIAAAGLRNLPPLQEKQQQEEREEEELN